MRPRGLDVHERALDVGLLAGAGTSFSRSDALLERLLERGRELVEEPARAREQARGERAPVVLLAHDHLLVGRHVEVEGLAVGHEQLRLGVLVLPAHAARRA